MFSICWTATGMLQAPAAAAALAWHVAEGLLHPVHRHRQVSLQHQRQHLTQLVRLQPRALQAQQTATAHTAAADSGLSALLQQPTWLRLLPQRTTIQQQLMQLPQLLLLRLLL